MATQLFDFKPVIPQHYTLAETQEEKDIENQRKIAQINAQQAGSMAEASLRGAYAAQAQDSAQALERERMGAVQQQQATQNAMEQRRLDANIAAQQQEQARLGVSDAMKADAYKRDIAQQEVQNGRMQAQDARAAVENQQKDEIYARKKAEEDMHNAWADMGEGFLNTAPDKKGERDFTPYKPAVEQGLGGKLGDVQVRAKANPETGNTEFFAVDKEGAYNPILKHGVPFALPDSGVEAMKSVAKARMGIKGGEDKQDMQIVYKDVVDTNGVTHRTASEVWDKVHNKTYPYPGASAQQAEELSQAQKAVMAAMGDEAPRVAGSKPGAVKESPAPEVKSAPIVSGLTPKPLVTVSDIGEEDQLPYNRNLMPKPSFGPRRTLVPKGR